MDRKRLGLMVSLALLAATTGCTIVPAKEPAPTIWYLVVTSTPAPSPTKWAPPTATATPPPTAPLTPTSPPAPTPPPLPTNPPTRPPTPPPLPPTDTPLPPPPTTAPTFTPGPTVPSQALCQGDEEMSFEPSSPRVGDQLTIQVTSAKAHRNVRLIGSGVSDAPNKVEDGRKGHIWIWYVTVPKAGRLDYTFYVENTTPCTANYCVAQAAAGVQLTCGNPHGTGGPGTTVKIMVTMKNTGGTQETFNVDISKAVPAGWNAAFCFGTVCYYSGPQPRTLGPGASEQIEVDFIIPADAPSGQQGSVTLSAVARSNASINASIEVSATRQ